MTKKDFILALCKAIGKPVTLYSSHDGYTCLKLTDGQFVDVYCDRCKSTKTHSLKFKFRPDTIGQTELDKVKKFLEKQTFWRFTKTDIYESRPDSPWSQYRTVLRIRNRGYWPWDYSRYEETTVRFPLFKSFSHKLMLR